MYWELVEFVETLSKRILTVWATPLALEALKKIPTRELFSTIALGGTQPIHDCTMKIQRWSVYIWHNSEEQPPIRLEREELQKKLSFLAKHQRLWISEDCPYEVVGFQSGLILVRDYSTEPSELLGIAAVSRELMPLIWMFNSPWLLKRLSFPFPILPLELEPESPSPQEPDVIETLFSKRPPGPFLDQLLVHGPIFGLVEPIWDGALAEVVWEGLAEREGITPEQARDRYPFLTLVSSCPWDETLLGRRPAGG